jgi:hypothetical protein
VNEILEPKFDDQQALPYGGESGVTYSQKYGEVPHKDMLSFIRERRAGRAVHSDGFLALGGMVEAAYECECGFNGLFLDVKCARCGKELGAVSSGQEATND